MKCVFVTVYIFIFNINKVLDVSIWKSPVAGWGWESIEAKDDWLRWLPVPFGLGFHLTMCVWPLPPLILGWPNRKPWWQQPFANRPGVMVRIAIGFYVDSKHKWSGCSTHLSIKNVVRNLKKIFQTVIWSISNPKDWCMCLYTVCAQFDWTVSLTITCVHTSFV